MPEETYSFTTARTRLEEIVTQVRRKDTSLERSLDLLEEGVRLANQCTELIDHADWDAAAAVSAEASDEEPVVGGEDALEGGREAEPAGQTEEDTASPEAAHD